MLDGVTLAPPGEYDRMICARGDSDAGRRYHYCDDLFVMVLRIRLKRRSLRFSCSLGLYMDDWTYSWYRIVLLLYTVLCY